MQFLIFDPEPEAISFDSKQNMGQHLPTKIKQHISECLFNIYPCFLIMLDKKNSM